MSNPLYIGRISHHGEHHEGRQPPIIDLETWGAVQAQLASQAPPSSSPRVRSISPSALRGKLFDEAGIKLTPKHAVKNGKRYRYYVSQVLASEGDIATRWAVDHAWRLPAREIERLVSEAVQSLFSDQAELALRVREAGIEESRIAELLTNVSRWDGRPLELIDRVDLAPGEVVILVDLRNLLKGHPTRIRHTVPTMIRRRGVETRLLLGGSEDKAKTSGRDPALVKAVVRGDGWFEDLATGRAQSLAEIAKAEGVTHRYVSRLIRLAFLAPDIIASVLAGTQPVSLTTEILTKQIDLPLAWAEQRELLGFNRSSGQP